MIKTRPNARHAGFSLLEVLLAVVVLSFGLLALAALQGSLFKTSAETKAQSIALGLATEKLEFFRGYSNVSGYQAIDSGADAAAINVGGVNYTRTWTVTRYAYPAAGGNFTLVGANTGGLSATYAPNTEFKRIRVDVTWGGWFTVDGGSERYPIDPPAHATGEPSVLGVVEARAENVTG